MKQTKIFLGSPLEVSSERHFLKQLSDDLAKQDQHALILGNFHPPYSPAFQIDFLVITSICVCHVELKRFTAPVVATANGRWKLKNPYGTLEPYNSKNPYHQARDNKYALSFSRNRDLEDVLCKMHSDRCTFHPDSSFLSIMTRLTLAHRCGPSQRRSPSYQLRGGYPSMQRLDQPSMFSSTEDLIERAYDLQGERIAYVKSSVEQAAE